MNRTFTSLFFPTLFFHRSKFDSFLLSPFFSENGMRCWLFLGKKREVFFSSSSSPSSITMTTTMVSLTTTERPHPNMHARIEQATEENIIIGEKRKKNWLKTDPVLSLFFIVTIYPPLSLCSHLTFIKKIETLKGKKYPN